MENADFHSACKIKQFHLLFKFYPHMKSELLVSNKLVQAACMHHPWWWLQAGDLRMLYFCQSLVAAAWTNPKQKT